MKSIKRLKQQKYLYILMIPGVLYFLILKYIPMFGVIIAFQDFDIFGGFLMSKWVSFKHFAAFFEGPHFWRLLRNTITLNVYLLIFGFPMPIILALALNEVRSQLYKRFVQTVTYLPHFISAVVVVAMVLDFLSPSSGIISLCISKITGGDPIYYITKPEYFRTIYVLADMWKGTGWGAIIFIAALTSIDQSLYEAAVVDGAGRWKKMLYITIPGILPVIIIVLILRLGHILDIGFDMAFLMQNPLNYETSDVIPTFVYRRGILGDQGALPDYSFATAVNLFQSAIGFIMVITANRISRRVSEICLW